MLILHFLTFIGGLSLLPTELILSFGFPYGPQKALTPPTSNVSLISNVRGVNLGGWLVLEVRRTSNFFY